MPGLLADSLPDRFGNAVLDAWLASQGRRPEECDAVERLCYTGTRGMGALEFSPVRGPRPTTATDIEIGELVQLASEILADREELTGSLQTDAKSDALRDILLVGTSAGGARAKAVIAYNSATNAIRSGQVDAGPGFEYWLLKFDGVTGDASRELEAPLGFGAIEFAYYEMALAAGIEMTECRLLPENGRRHFMTRRLDRTVTGAKLHMQSLGALAHFDFRLAGGYAYEQALQTIRQLGLGLDAVEEQFRRMAFNVIARNQDDHVKNIAFLMDRSGGWSLSPAFDLTYAYNPRGVWTRQHQMSVNGKRDDFTRADFDDCARTAGMKGGRAKEILREVRDAVGEWRRFATGAQVDPGDVDRIARAHRLSLPD